MLSFDHWPYEGTPVVVLSSRNLRIPDHLAGKVSASSGPPEQIASRLATEGKNICISTAAKPFSGFLKRT